MERSKHVKCITINTDASFHPEHKAAGYAFTIVSDIFRIRKGGMFQKVKPKTAQEAEIMCIGNAIATLLCQKELPTTTHLVLNNDCKYGMTEIRTGNSSHAVEVSKLWQELRRRTKCRYHSMRHVKAHTGTDDKRSQANDWCDREAKRWMRKAVKEGGSV